MSEIKILSVNISEKKGTIKTPVGKIKITTKGVSKDAHAGDWHRQISLLGSESIKKVEKTAKRKIKFGEFAENITTEGLELWKTNPLDRFIINNVELEVTQIGKKCHGEKCAIFKEVGNCVMPKEGIFCRVIKGGEISEGAQGDYIPKIFKTLIITLSDRASKGEYEDLSGPSVSDKLGKHFESKGRKYFIERQVIPDDKKLLKEKFTKAIEKEYDFVFTTGGTGIGPRDITTDVIAPLLDKQITGIMELIRVKYGQEKPAALLSRSIAGVKGATLIYCIPGSVKAVEEYMTEILKTIDHSVYMLHGLDLH
jgi:molybdenum cofactor synthesis domain-containing protein